MLYVGLTLKISSVHALDDLGAPLISSAVLDGGLLVNYQEDKMLISSPLAFSRLLRRDSSPKSRPQA